MNQPPPSEGSPAAPETATSWREYGAALRALRDGRKLTITALEAKHPDTLRRSTISAYELGNGRPSLSWTRLYVTACLRHRNPTLTPERLTAEQLTAELDRWETAWTRLNRKAVTPANPPPAPVEPEPRPADPDTPPAPAGHHQTPPATPDTAPNEPKPPRVRLPRSRVVLIGGGVGVLVVAATITAATTGAFTTPNPAPAPAPTTVPAPLTGVAVPASPSATPAPLTSSAVPVPAPVVYASGTVDDLGTKEGIDLDTGQRRDQYAPGVDISFSSTSTHMDAMHPSVYYQVLPQPVTQPEKRMCELDTGWKRWYADVHSLTEGRNICVKTDEGRLSMMTITKRATNATGTISLRYVTWP